MQFEKQLTRCVLASRKTSLPSQSYLLACCWPATLQAEIMFQLAIEPCVFVFRHMSRQMWTEQTVGPGAGTTLRVPSTRLRSAPYLRLPRTLHNMSSCPVVPLIPLSDCFESICQPQHRNLLSPEKLSLLHCMLGTAWTCHIEAHQTAFRHPEDSIAPSYLQALVPHYSLSHCAECTGASESLHTALEPHFWFWHS